MIAALDAGLMEEFAFLLGRSARVILIVEPLKVENFEQPLLMALDKQLFSSYKETPERVPLRDKP